MSTSNPAWQAAARGALWLALLGGCAEDADPAEPAAGDSATSGPGAERLAEGDPAADAAAVPEEAPGVEVLPALLDLGILEPTLQYENELELRNTSDRPLFITDQWTNCKCLKLVLDRTPLQPGEVRKIPIKVRAESRGSRDLMYKLTTTDRGAPEVTGIVRYVLQPVLGVEPKSLDFGARQVGEEAVIEIRASANVPHVTEQFELAPFVSGGAPLRLEEGERERYSMTEVLDRVNIHYRVILDTSAPTGSEFQEHIVFEGEGYTGMTVPVRGRVFDGYYFTASQVHFGVCKVGDRKRKTLGILFGGELPEVLRVETQFPDTKATAEVDEERGKIQLALVFRPTEAGEFSGTAEVYTTLREAPIVVDLKARVR